MGARKVQNLFVDLYAYRQREARNPVEDWLTECLAAVLRSLTPTQAASVFARLSGQPREAIVAAVLRQGRAITVHTQVPIERDPATGSRQRPDLLVRVGDRPWLLFENKVAHVVDVTQVANEPVEHQLHRYGAWLGRQELEVDGLSKALVFVTHLTPPPEDFTDHHIRHPAYEGLGPGMVWSWGNVSRILLQETRESDERALAPNLASALAGYLKEHDMANEYPAHQDVAVADLYLGKEALFINLVNDMFRRIWRSTFLEGNARWAKVYQNCGVYGASQNVCASELIPEKTYVEVGLWFPEVGDWRNGEIVRELSGKDVSTSPKVYLALANQTDGAFHALPGAPEGWHELNTDKLVFRDFSSFHGDPERRAQAIFAWVDEEIAKLKTYLEP